MVNEIIILKTKGCDSCSAASEIISKVKEKNNLNFIIREVDVSEYPELMIKYQLMVVPGIVIDGKLEFTGSITEREFKLKVMS
jgi:glutaredoxin